MNEGHTIFFSNTSGRSLRIVKNGNVNANGGKGPFARFIIENMSAGGGNSSLVRLQNVKDQNLFLHCDASGNVAGTTNKSGTGTLFLINTIDKQKCTIQHSQTKMYLNARQGGKVYTSKNIIDTFSMLTVKPPPGSIITKTPELKIPDGIQLSKAQCQEFYANRYIILKNLIPKHIQSA
eukprot:UN29967